MYLLILTLSFALLVAIFAIQNAAPVAIKLFWITAQVPLVLVILGSVLAGASYCFFNFDVASIPSQYGFKSKDLNEAWK